MLFPDPPRLWCYGAGELTHPVASGGRGTTFARTARGHKCRFGLRRAKKGPKRASNGPRWGSSGCSPHGRSRGPPARVLVGGLRGTRLCRRGLYRGDTDHALGLSSASVSCMYLFTSLSFLPLTSQYLYSMKYRNFLVRPSFPGRAYVPSSSHIHFFYGYVTVDASTT